MWLMSCSSHRASTTNSLICIWITEISCCLINETTLFLRTNYYDSGLQSIYYV